MKSILPSDPIKEPTKELINLSNLGNYNGHIIGQILTIIDATLPQGIQNESVKSLIKNKIWDSFGVVRDWYYTDGIYEKDMTTTNQKSFPYGD